MSVWGNSPGTGQRAVYSKNNYYWKQLRRRPLRASPLNNKSAEL
jgi:hypothetical protein